MIRNSILALALFATGCALDPTTISPIGERAGEGEGEEMVFAIPAIGLYENEAPEWALAEMQATIDVWAAHGVPFAFTNNPEDIAIETLYVEGGIGGVFTPESIYVIEGPEMDTLNQSCVLAAELARIILMIDNAGNGGSGGLLGPILPFLPTDTPCPFTELDRQTVCDWEPAICEVTP
jgi:hypothetical protein